MSDLVERVALAIGQAMGKDDPRFEVDWPHLMCPDANAGVDLRLVAQAAIDEITKNAEPCGVCGCAVYKGLPTAVGQSTGT